MLLSRGLREQLAANERAARLDEAAGIVLTALTDPGVRAAIASVVARDPGRQARPRPATATEVKAARAAARGRRPRG